MKNPKTTISGYLVLAGAVATIVAHMVGGQGLGAVDFSNLLAALAGVGLVVSSDGGH